MDGNYSRSVESRCEVFNPITRESRITRGKLKAARSHFAACLLPDGKVFVCGGYDGDTKVSSTEIYTPSEDSFTDGPSMLVPRMEHVATLLLDGRVLICCGDSYQTWGGPRSAELFDYKTNTFRSIADTRKMRSYFPFATLLVDGRVFIFGGDHAGLIGSNGRLTSEIFDPKTNAFSDSGISPPIW
jgi:hypothetical protein